MPFSFTLDATPEQVITGWDEGVTGMKGGRPARMVIPPTWLRLRPRQPGIAPAPALILHRRPAQVS